MRQIELVTYPECLELRNHCEGKPGINQGLIRGMILSFPAALIVWGGILYAATRLIH